MQKNLHFYAETKQKKQTKTIIRMCQWRLLDGPRGINIVIERWSIVLLVLFITGAGRRNFQSWQPACFHLFILLCEASAPWGMIPKAEFQSLPFEMDLLTVVK